MIAKSDRDIIAIPLKNVTYHWLVESSTEWKSDIAEARSLVGEHLKISKSAIVTSFGLYWMPWDFRHRGKDRPRMWWCPTGPFAHLPIDAAGVQNSRCSDYVVSSYTPTLGALLAARSAYARVEKQRVRVLAAAVPQSYAAQWKDLLFASEDVAAVKAIVPEGAAITISSDDDSQSGDVGVTVAAFLEKLLQATMVHLACHGHQDADDPLNSGFVMCDETLTIERLMPIPLPNAFMAFLSACETAKGDIKQPDQAIHLAATMLFAGFKSVIATLGGLKVGDYALIMCWIMRRFCVDSGVATRL
ncbi:hypothetical protein PUNSTDRAFT_128797 [Punctularia strigosozonata HHB-11173 SS5]|uniref:uncharacterized protein n=1 Tax=Punctularia strigosozonata (strain HHB-11173) TaxID=741275 RepID=UPI0004418719|nr:uncharacterized protein PUNSTDRAFT_128797 [Punctularia strigosozonata HHB-11173 SS5]EIN13114.1 hypothetical protein PUNSTDRAFT_128797 [Punctularia strigosozonata HHB-11173 SS5]